MQLLAPPEQERKSFQSQALAFARAVLGPDFDPRSDSKKSAEHDPENVDLVHGSNEVEFAAVVGEDGSPRAVLVGGDRSGPTELGASALLPGLHGDPESAQSSLDDLMNGIQRDVRQLEAAHRTGRTHFVNFLGQKQLFGDFLGGGATRKEHSSASSSAGGAGGGAGPVLAATSTFGGGGVSFGHGGFSGGSSGGVVVPETVAASQQDLPIAYSLDTGERILVRESDSDPPHPKDDSGGEDGETRYRLDDAGTGELRTAHEKSGSSKASRRKNSQSPRGPPAAHSSALAIRDEQAIAQSQKVRKLESLLRYQEVLTQQDGKAVESLQRTVVTLLRALESSQRDLRLLSEIKNPPIAENDAQGQQSASKEQSALRDEEDVEEAAAKAEQRKLDEEDRTLLNNERMLALNREAAQLQEVLAAREAQLGEKERALQFVEQQRDDLRSREDNLQLQVAELRATLDGLGKQAAEQLAASRGSSKRTRSPAGGTFQCSEEVPSIREQNLHRQLQTQKAELETVKELNKDLMRQGLLADQKLEEQRQFGEAKQTQLGEAESQAKILVQKKESAERELAVRSGELTAANARITELEKELAACFEDLEGGAFSPRGFTGARPRNSSDDDASGNGRWQMITVGSVHSKESLSVQQKSERARTNWARAKRHALEKENAELRKEEAVLRNHVAVLRDKQEVLVKQATTVQVVDANGMIVDTVGAEAPRTGPGADPDGHEAGDKIGELNDRLRNSVDRLWKHSPAMAVKMEQHSAEVVEKLAKSWRMIAVERAKKRRGRGGNSGSIMSGVARSGSEGVVGGGNGSGSGSTDSKMRAHFGGL